MIDNEFDIATALTEMGMSHITQTFWLIGEVPDKIGYIKANSVAYMRLAALVIEFEKADYQFDRDELIAMLIYMQHAQLKFKREVAAIKFRILKAAEEKGVEWTCKLDHDADQAAWRMARTITTKRKTR